MFHKLGKFTIRWLAPIRTTHVVFVPLFMFMLIFKGC